MKYLLDTNICISLLKNSDQAVVKKLKSLAPDKVVICSVVKAELLYGARKSQSVEKNLPTSPILTLYPIEYIIN